MTDPDQDTDVPECSSCPANRRSALKFWWRVLSLPLDLLAIALVLVLLYAVFCPQGSNVVDNTIAEIQSAVVGQVDDFRLWFVVERDGQLYQGTVVKTGDDLKVNNATELVTEHASHEYVWIKVPRNAVSGWGDANAADKTPPAAVRGDNAPVRRTVRSGVYCPGSGEPYLHRPSSI